MNFLRGFQRRGGLEKPWMKIKLGKRDEDQETSSNPRVLSFCLFSMKNLYFESMNCLYLVYMME